MAVARAASGRWTTRLCEACRQRRCMPASEVVCRNCAPFGGPRSWRLARLREARLRAGLSLAELAGRAGVTEPTIIRAERPGSRVQTATAAAIAGALQTSVSALVNERGVG